MKQNTDQHTPGPWVNLTEGGFIHAPSTDQVVCQMWSKFEQDFHNHKANARLIAASPDLLEALKASIPILEEVADLDTGEQPCIGSDAGNALAIIRAAIAKAQPEQKEGM